MPGWLTDYFKFLTFGQSLALNPARQSGRQKNEKWSVSLPGIESLSQCPHFGTLEKIG